IRYLLYSLNNIPSDGAVGTASGMISISVGTARSSSSIARRMCQSEVTRRKDVSLRRAAQRAVSKALERVSTDWKPRSMQHSNRPSGRLYSTASSCGFTSRSEEHTSELQSRENLVCRLLLEKK